MPGQTQGIAPPDKAILALFFTSERIKRMRLAAGMMQSELADRLELGGSQTISNWEVGRFYPSNRSYADLWRWYVELVSTGQFPDEFSAGT